MNVSVLVAIWIGCCLSAGSLSAQTGLVGVYYRGTRFEHPVLTRQDSALNFNWPTGGPVVGLPLSHYSVRWTGTLLAPVTGSYQFSARADEGIRVWVDNQLVVESWPATSNQRFEGSLMLQAGRRYDIWVDYYSTRAGGTVQLFWQRPDVNSSFWKHYFSADEIIPARYFGHKAPPRMVTADSRVAALPVRPRQEQTRKKVAVSRLKGAVLRAKPVNVPAAVPSIPPLPNVAPWLAELTIGKPFSLPQVQFEQSSYRLVAESATVLDQLALALKQHENWQLEIVGHTDNVGDARLNQALSEQRARVVAHFLVRGGVAAARIRTRGEGGNRPIADNERESERARNRRVEFTIL
ncbi:MAG: OmpA family protein [Bacteroidetes bacterium]|nr:OmpA family protein [Fibrella sp.]